MLYEEVDQKIPELSGTTKGMPAAIYGVYRIGENEHLVSIVGKRPEFFSPVISSEVPAGLYVYDAITSRDIPPRLIPLETIDALIILKPEIRSL